MIFGYWGVALNLLMIALITACFVVLVNSAVTSLGTPYINRISPKARIGLFWTLAYTPWVLAILIAFVFYGLTYWEISLSSSRALPHWHHPEVFEILSWHGVALFSFATWFSISISRHIQTLRRSIVKRRSLELFAKEVVNENGQRYYLLDTDKFDAFTVGLLNPKCYVTTGLYKHLTASELDIVLQHEFAHIDGRDTFRKWIFSLLSSFYPGKVSNTLNREFALTVEQLADLKVVEQGYYPDAIANTLLKTVRCTLNKCTGCIERPIALASYFHLDDVEQRVYALLSNDKGSTNILMPMLLFVSSVFLLSLYSVDSIHHLIESLLNH